MPRGGPRVGVRFGRDRAEGGVECPVPLWGTRDGGTTVHGFRSLRDLHPWLQPGAPSGLERAWE
jgi:hypothetical protein